MCYWLPSHMYESRLQTMLLVRLSNTYCEIWGWIPGWIKENWDFHLIAIHHFAKIFLLFLQSVYYFYLFLLSQKMFVRGLRQYGKNFFRIKTENLPHKETVSISEINLQCQLSAKLMTAFFLSFLYQ